MNIPSKFSISAPGKVILHGEHSVVYGHQAIAASLNLRSRIDYKALQNSQGNENFLLLSFPNVELKVALSIRSVTHQLFILTGSGSWDIDNPERVEFEELLLGIRNFIKSEPQLQDLAPKQQQTITCCLFLMTAIFHKPKQSESVELQPFSLEFSSELPIGAGAGSSASFCVCLSAAFLFIASANSKQQRQYSLNENMKDLISRWAFRGECIMHGKPSGLDNYVCTFGSAIAFQSPNNISRIPLSCSLRVLLVDTKVSRQTRALVESVASLREYHRNVVEHIMEAMDCISKEAIALFKKMDAEESKEKQIEAFSRMEELWSMNHSLLTALGVSHPSLEQIIQLSRNHKLSGKLTGAGGGGFAIILVPPPSLHNTSDEHALKSLTAALKDGGFDVKDVQLGGPGVQLH